MVEPMAAISNRKAISSRLKMIQKALMSPLLKWLFTAVNIIKAAVAAMRPVICQAKL